jgi:CheY-like chemotaxis protein
LSLPKPESPEAQVSPGSDKGAILVAEDHVDSRQTLARVLRRMGYRVFEAGNGRDALAIVDRERLLAVLMDVNMPVMDGVEATLALRADARHRDLPIFALTGDVTLVNQHRIGEAGVNGYLEKPVTWDVLKRALGTLGPRPAD